MRYMLLTYYHIIISNTARFVILISQRRFSTESRWCQIELQRKKGGTVIEVTPKSWTD